MASGKRSVCASCWNFWSRLALSNQERRQMDLNKNMKSIQPIDSVITLPAYPNQSGFLYRYLHRYENIILMMDMNAYGYQAKTSLIFFDTQKSRLVTPPDWIAYEKSCRIFEIYPIKSCVFSLALSGEKCILSCFEMKYHTWQNCEIPVEWSHNCFSSPRIQMEYDGTTLYAGILDTKTTFWRYFKIIRTQKDLYLEPLSFLRGNFMLFRPIWSSQDEMVFCASGNSMEIQNAHEASFQKVNAHDAMIRYRHSGVEIIAADSEYSSFEYDTRVGKCIYYELMKASKSTLMRYDLASHNNHIVSADPEQYIALSSEEDLYTYNHAAFQRMSDGKKFSVDAVMHAFQTLNVPAIDEIEPFPSMCFFHDHWLEIEVCDFRFSVIHLDTMQPYYLEGVIDVVGEHIYHYV